MIYINHGMTGTEVAEALADDPEEIIYALEALADRYDQFRGDVLDIISGTTADTIAGFLRSRSTLLNPRSESRQTMEPIKIEANTMERASEMYIRLRDESGLGASQFPTGVWLPPGEKEVRPISYNGRIWKDKNSWQHEPPLYDPANKPGVSPKLSHNDLMEHLRQDGEGKFIDPVAAVAVPLSLIKGVLAQLTIEEMNEAVIEISLALLLAPSERMGAADAAARDQDSDEDAG